jgi:hypothetical protein
VGAVREELTRRQDRATELLTALVDAADPLAVAQARVHELNEVMPGPRDRAAHLPWCCPCLRGAGAPPMGKGT